MNHNFEVNGQSLSRVSSYRYFGIEVDETVRRLAIVVNLYLTRVIPSEYLKVYLLSIGALN